METNLTCAQHIALVVASLSQLAFDAQVSMEVERTAPGFDPDRMDDIITFNRERSTNLRRLRNEFEDEMARCRP